MWGNLFNVVKSTREVNESGVLSRITGIENGKTVIEGGNLRTGSILANSIGAGSITADRLFIGDSTNLMQFNEMTSTGGNATETVSSLVYFKIGNSTTAGYYGLRFCRSYSMDFKVGDQYQLTFYGYKTTTGNPNFIIRYYFSDGTYLNAGSATATIGTADALVTVNCTIANAPTAGKTLSRIEYFLEINNEINFIWLRNVELRKRFAGSLIVDGSITTSHVSATGISATSIKAGTLVSSNNTSGTPHSLLDMTTGALRLGLTTGATYLEWTGSALNIKANSLSIGANSVPSTQIDVVAKANGSTSTDTTKGIFLSGTDLQINASKITAGSISASRIDAGTINAHHLNVVARNLVNNPTITGNVSNYTSNAAFTYATDNATSPYVGYGTGKIVSTGDVQITSDRFEINPSKMYKVKISVLGTNLNSKYVGLYTYNNAGTNINVTPFALSSRTFGTTTNNFYFWNNSKASTGGWIEIEGYILPHDIHSSEIPVLGTGKTCTNYAQFRPDARYMEIRFLSYNSSTAYGDGTTSCTAHFANMSVTEMNSSGIHADNITAGTISTSRLSANNIVSVINGGSTTISGDKITTGSITADKISAKSLTVNKLKIPSSDKNFFTQSASLFGQVRYPCRVVSGVSLQKPDGIFGSPLPLSRDWEENFLNLGDSIYLDITAQLVGPPTNYYIAVEYYSDNKTLISREILYNASDMQQSGKTGTWNRFLTTVTIKSTDVNIAEYVLFTIHHASSSTYDVMVDLTKSNIIFKGVNGGAIVGTLKSVDGKNSLDLTQGSLSIGDSGRIEIKNSNNKVLFGANKSGITLHETGINMKIGGVIWNSTTGIYEQEDPSTYGEGSGSVTARGISGRWSNPTGTAYWSYKFNPEGIGIENSGGSYLYWTRFNIDSGTQAGFDGVSITEGYGKIKMFGELGLEFDSAQNDLVFKKKILAYGVTGGDYYQGGMEIRERGLLATAVSSDVDAPSIGFHWGGRAAGTLAMHNDGHFYFRAQGFTNGVTIDNLRRVHGRDFYALNNLMTNRYLQIQAWPGYGSGWGNMYYDGTLSSFRGSQAGFYGEKESKFTDGTAYSDPWSGTACAIKTKGHVAVGGTLNVNGLAYTQGLTIDGYGANGYLRGTGDGATWTTYNAYIKSWWGLAIRDNTDTPRILFDARTGNVSLKGTLSQASSREWKKGIEETKKNALDIIANTKVYEYHMNDEKEDIDFKHIGFIYEESPIEIVNPNAGIAGINLYPAIALAWKAIQELKNENESLKERIELLDKKKGFGFSLKGKKEKKEG